MFIHYNKAPWILSSRVGYDIGDPIHIIIRSDDFKSLAQNSMLKLTKLGTKEHIIRSVKYWGEKWNSHWWIIDYSNQLTKGTYSVQLLYDGKILKKGDNIEIGENQLWKKTAHTIIFDFLKTRSELARTNFGWKDSGSDLQEFSSHAVCVDGICDILELIGDEFIAEQKDFLVSQLIRGGDYMAHLQDKTKGQTLGEGAVYHEDRDQDIVTGNVIKAAYIFARLSRLLNSYNIEKSKEYLKRANLAYLWIEQHGPIFPPGSQDFFPFIHGAPKNSIPPVDQFMTRDLLRLMGAAIELYKCGEEEYKPKAISLASQIMSRQVMNNNSEGAFYGHLYTYSDFSSFNDIRFTEKANIHCGAWSQDGRIYNKGGHYPHYLLPFIEMINIWPDHPEVPDWMNVLKNFIYGYLIPACSSSPFLILPAGYYYDQGLMYFGSWYHGHNNIYAFIASIAIELNKIFEEPQLHQIAVANLQWIAGLNCGKQEKKRSGYLPISMIHGIGTRYSGSWSKIPGSVCNGFSASPQFKITPITVDSDNPVFFDDEAYIAHSLPFIAAVTRKFVQKKQKSII